MFVTAWMGILDITTGQVKFANAGHNQTLLNRANGYFEYLKTRAGFVLAGMEGIRYRAGELTLYPGDRLFLYTDGVTEAENKEHSLYSDERLLELLDKQRKNMPCTIVDEVLHDVNKNADGAEQSDDITIMCIVNKKP